MKKNRKSNMVNYFTKQSRGKNPRTLYYKKVGKGKAQRISKQQYIKKLVQINSQMQQMVKQGAKKTKITSPKPVKTKIQGDHKLIAIDLHRNGVSGEPFYIALFESKVDWSDWPVVPRGKNKNLFQVVYFPPDEDRDDALRLAVSNVALSNMRNIAFHNNSWRPGFWVEAMLEAVALYRDASAKRFRLPQQQRKKHIRKYDKTTGIVQLKNKNIAFTGTMPHTRKELEAKLKKIGAKFHASITKETDLLIKGSKPGKTKVAAAKKNKIPIVSFSVVQHRFK